MATVLSNRGKEIQVDRLMGNGTEPKYVGWGTGAGTAAAADTDLFTAATEARVNGTSSKVTTTTTNDTYQTVATLTVAGSGKTITNVATFDAAGSGSPPSGGNMHVKGDFTGVTLAVGESIQFTIKTQFS